MERCNLDIVIYMNGMTVDYDTMTRKSLGGSETAGVSMAHALAKRGHHVSLFCNTDNAGKHDGVNYIPIDSFMQYASTCPHDVLICQRVPMVFQQHFASKINILWQHDYAQKSQRAEFTGALWNVDKVFCLSDWHINNYLETYKLLAEDNAFFKTSNGIKLIKPNNQPRKNQVVFTNRPERGMDNLLYNILPKLWEKDQEIEVVIAGYDNTVPQMQQYYSTLANTIKAYAEKGFKIRHVGALTKKDLYKLYQESKLFLYPTNFYETSCITAMETQMCGLPMITSNRGALPETLGKNAGIIIDGQANSPEYTEKFVESAWKLMNDEIAYKKCQKEGYEYVKKYDWDNVAKQWEKQFLDMFSEMTAKRQSLYHHLYEREDIMTYKYLAEKVDCDKERAEGLECLYGYIDSPKLYKQKYEQLGKEYAKIETDIELRAYHRVNVAMDGISNYLKDRKITSPKMLDFASGIGNESILFTKEYNAKVDAVNISAEENILAEKMKNKFAPKADINFLVGQDGSQLKENYYDVLFMGEILEHQPNPHIFIDELEKNVKKGGLISFTVPFGMWDDRRNAHLWNFERQDLSQMLRDKNNLSIKIVSSDINVNKQEARGWWVVSYTTNNKTCYPIDMDRKINISAPVQTVSVCMITKNAEDMLHRCLKSVKDLANEIIICDNGSTDSTLDIAREYKAKIITCKPATEIGFDTARNHSIKDAKSDWILWIDSDEELLDPINVRKYLRNNMFNGYSLKQHHFTADGSEIKIDMPVRLFRNNIGIKFLGHVHEHPELGINQGVGSSTVLSDANIAHDGYLTESVRRGRFLRNIELMKKDRQLNPERILGKFLWVRDLIHLARYEIQKNNGSLTQNAVNYCEEAQELFRKEFLTTKTMYQEEALMFYSESLRMLQVGIDYTFSINADLENPEQGRLHIGRFINKEEFFAYLQSYYEEVSEHLEGDFI
mgnify:CR=1 FL=1|jgi:glycosyltransferase involved in cell wall biosynthesis/SAM-dependent methyltransferase